jgi:branched-chain amino acid transport system ATP-binding protein
MSASPPTARLECRGLDAGYSRAPVVRGLDLVVEAGDVLALLGPNGAGKTTTLLTVSGFLPPIAGEAVVNGHQLRRGDPAAASKRGVVLVPDDRALFTALTTRENLQLGMRKASRRMSDQLTVDDVLGYFPALVKRLDLKAGLLSGGEQQMLALARGLVQRPQVLLIDELSMGLAPIIVEELLPVIRRVATETRTAVVLVEQHVDLALAIADQALVMVHGRVALRGLARDLLSDIAALEHAYLGENAPPTTR